jgi:hypothetical protein
MGLLLAGTVGCGAIADAGSSAEGLDKPLTPDDVTWLGGKAWGRPGSAPVRDGDLVAVKFDSTVGPDGLGYSVYAVSRAACNDCQMATFADARAAKALVSYRLNVPPQPRGNANAAAIGTSALRPLGCMLIGRASTLLYPEGTTVVQIPYGLDARGNQTPGPVPAFKSAAGVVPLEDVDFDPAIVATLPAC